MLLTALRAELPSASLVPRPGAGIGGTDDDVDVLDVVQDSRAVTAGSLFCCITGAHSDGHDHAPAAVSAGAVALLVERPLDLPVPQLVVPDTRTAVAPAAAAVFGHPSRSLTVIGVTGTNGKTTTTHLLRNVLEAAGLRTEVLGTLSGARTTPEASDLQRQLAIWRDDGVQAVAMEVSSHALELHRVDAMRFRVAVFTNLSRDHLDFHGSTEAYFSAKARLFEPDLSDRAVVNLDSPYGRLLADTVSIPVDGFELAEAEDLVLTAAGSTFTWRGRRVQLSLGGAFNVSNAIAAAHAAAAVGVDDEDVVGGLSRPLVVSGRFEQVRAGQPFAVIVDYAHTPDGLDQLLMAADDLVGPGPDGERGRVVVVFGCGGDRDATKRPAMGEVAARRADRVVVTADNSLSRGHGGHHRGRDARIRQDPSAAGGRAARRAGPASRHRRGADRSPVRGCGAAGREGPRDHPGAGRRGPPVRRPGGRRRGVGPPRWSAVIRLLVAAGVALAVSLIGTLLLIGWLERRHIGQPIREDGPQGHITKAGTPTMGGIAIVLAAGVAWLISDFTGAVYTRRGFIIISTIVLAGIVGLVDDGIKVFRERNLGLNKRAKTLGLLVVAVGYAVSMLVFTNVKTTISFTRWDVPGWDIGNVGWAIMAVILIYATTNAVNLTDGLDGLAAGSSIFAYAAFVVISFWGFRHTGVYSDESFLDTAVVAAGMVGGCAGFLWWNAAPARIFMGDTGSLAIGAGLAAMALSTNTVLLLPLIGGVFVMETVSVILQIGSFRMFGRRIFRMAPLHHHFELGGWPETTVIIRLWIVAGLFTALALGLYYADFVSLPGTID